MEAASEEDKTAVATAAALGAAIAARVSNDDIEGREARAAVAEFAAKAAELDALLEDSDDDKPIVSAARPDASELIAQRLAALEVETAWQEGPVGLELQRPFSTLLLSGAKAVETRTYPLPAQLVGREIDVLETAEAQACVSGLADNVPADDPAVRLVGSLTFGGCVAYANREEFLQDEARHCVPANSPYSWAAERPVFAWVVVARTSLPQPTPAPDLRRRFRSLFQLGPDAVSSGGSKRARREEGEA